MKLSMTILIVERNPIVALDLSEMILSRGFSRVFAVASNDEARKVVDEEGVTTALLDLNLNNWQEGVAFATHLIDQSNAKIIYLIGDETAVDLPKVMRTNPISIIGKPFVDEEIVVAMRMAKSYCYDFLS